jgi:hypothetical protein
LTGRYLEIIGLDVDLNGVLTLISSGVIGCAFIGVSSIWIDPFDPPIPYWLAGIGGVLKAIGVYWLNESIMVGYVGPP